MTSGSIAYRGAFFGGGSGPIFLEKLNCRSTSATLLDCARPPFGVHSCDHSMDAGVTCIGMCICVYSLKYSCLFISKHH